jgi:hypothetical protein
MASSLGFGLTSTSAPVVTPAAKVADIDALQAQSFSLWNVPGLHTFLISAGGGGGEDYGLAGGHNPPTGVFWTFRAALAGSLGGVSRDEAKEDEHIHESDEEVVIKLVACTSCVQVVAVEGRGDAAPLSIWRASLPAGCVRLGDFAHRSLRKPFFRARANSSRHQNLGGDDGEEMHDSLLVAKDHPYLQRPTGYRLLWSCEVANKAFSVFLWLPLPPTEEYVALGCVASTSAATPSLDLVRCVHVSQVRVISI